MAATAKIPYAYVRGAELGLIPQQPSAPLAADDGVHQVLISLRSRLRDIPEARGIVDGLAAQFGIMPVDAEVAHAVSLRCGYSNLTLIR